MTVSLNPTDRVAARSGSRLHYCRVDRDGHPRCTCGWHERGPFTPGDARSAEIDHLIAVGATWADRLSLQ
jgi:hypothetical protein